MHDILQAAADRAVLRRQVRLPCQVVEEESFALLARECVDLSLQGMGVKACLPAPVGTRVIASFRVPYSSLYVDVEAEVARIMWGRRRGEHYAALGLKFLNLTPVDRAILGSRLRGMPPPAPERPIRFDYARSVSAIFGDVSRAA